MSITCSSILDVVGKCFSVIPLVKDDFLYLWCYEENIENLKNQIEELKAKHATVEILEQQGCSTRSEETTEEVKHWFSTVNKALDDSCKIEEKVGQERENRPRWRCPNWWARYQLSKEIAQLAESVKEIIRKGNFTRVTVVPPTPSIEPVLDYSVAFASTDSVLGRILQALQDDENKIIGVHGMGGVGKTTLMKRLNNKLEKIQLFHKVIMVTVSQNPDVRTIRDGIAERLGFKFTGVDPYTHARKLSERLKEVRELLIILDDVWSRFELHEVGIPCRSEHEGCRIILTTRNKDICRQMGTQWNIELEVLPDAESWALLKSKVGDVVDSVKIKQIAKQILKSCKGLPLAIVTIGSTLKMQEDEHMWNDALRALNSASKTELEGVMPEVIESIRFSYDSIKGEGMKRFFLLCCLFPEDWEIDPSTLLAYGIGERCFGECSNYEEARDKSYVFIKKLKASSLLLEDYNSKRVVMHDIVRDVAIYIASNEHDFFVRSGPKLDKWPGIEELGKCSRISLMNNEITTLPNKPKCPELLSLILQGNECFEKMPDLFFENMRGLVVLDLGRTKIQQLPSSISYLKCLRVLLLGECKELKEISAIEGLEKLLTLDLTGTAIRELPKGIKGLTSLKQLVLSETRFLTVSSNLISSLSCLEELYMSRSFSGWETRNQGDGSNAHLSEVTSLPCLALLQIDVESPNLWYEDHFAPLINLTSFSIRGKFYAFGKNCIFENSLPHCSRVIQICDINILRISDWVKIFLQKIEELILEDVEGLNNILQLDAWDLNSLTDLSIDGNDEMKYLFNVEKELTHIAFPRLTKVSLYNMWSLISIWKGAVPVGSLNSLEELAIKFCDNIKYLFSTTLMRALQSLKRLEIVGCREMEKIISDEEETVVAGDGLLPQELTKPLALCNLHHLFIYGCSNLKYLFPYRLVQNLMHMRTIEVRNCPEMEEIIFIDKDKEHVDENILPMLKDIHLSDLPKLRTICKGRPTFHCPSLEELCVMLCPQLKRLPVGSQSAPRLRRLRVQKKWLEGLEWEDETIKLRLSSLAYKELMRNSFGGFTANVDLYLHFALDIPKRRARGDP